MTNKIVLSLMKIILINIELRLGATNQIEDHLNVIKELY